MLQRTLGIGGFGEAWLAIDPQRKDDRRTGEVVLKFLKAEFRASEELIDDFTASYRRVQALHHQHICALYDLGHHDRLGVFQVMQYVPGVTLQRYLRSHDVSRSGLPLDQVIPLLQKVAAALEFAHLNGILHRDVTPGNIMIDESTDHVTVLDFGLAADLRNSLSQRNIVADRVRGTPSCMAPEQWRANSSQQCAATDQYALAVVAWRMLTGDFPFSGDTEVLRLAVLTENIPRLPEKLAALQPVFEQALAKQPEQRYGTVTQFVQALRQAGGTAPPSVKDVATELKRRTELLTSTTQQAGALASRGQFTQALQLLDALPAGLQSQRNSDVYQQCLTGQARVQLLIGQLHTAVQETQSIRVRSLLTELQQLQPGETAWRNQLDELKSWTPPDQPSPLKAPFDAAAAANGQRLWAQFLRCSVDVQGPLGLRFRLIPPGSFLMGSTETRKDLEAAGFVIPEGISVDDEHPQHAVQLTSPYFLGTTAVTRGQFARFVQATGYLTDAERDGKGGWGYVPSKGSDEQRPEFNWQNTGFEQSDDHPVVNVSFQDAMAFLDWLNGQPPVEGILRRFRLPTEAEWEYACRAGTTTRFWTGDDFASLLGAANVRDISMQKAYPRLDYKKWQPFPFDDGVAFTARCGSFRANPFGLFDMAGNTWDWCSDWYSSGYYAKSPAADPAGPASGSSRVVRGGCWNYGPDSVRAGYRNDYDPGNRSSNIGFRVCSDS
ncbi:MAG: SUMF1/EgtB/PvdO family nonheme iron enzyme [Planctomyces sp.]